MTKESKPRKIRPPKSGVNLPPEIDEILRPIAQQAVARGQTLGEMLADDQPFAQLLGRLTEMCLQTEMDAHLGFERGERGHQPRDNVRNGTSAKTLKTPLGPVRIEVPRDRQADFEPHIVGKYARVSEPVSQAALAMYARGMSTEDIRQQLSEIYHAHFDEDFLTRCLERIEPELQAWRDRPLEPLYVAIFLDAIHLKIRRSCGVETVAAYVALGLGEALQTQILGLWLPPEGQEAESASFWHHVLTELRSRGVDDVLVVCADGLTGLPQAVEAAFPRAHFISCVVHLIRNSLRWVPWSQKKQVAADLRTIYAAPTFAMAKQALEQVESRWGREYPHMLRIWREALPRLENLWTYSPALRTLLYTTNRIENVHNRLRKVVKNRRSFPNTNSASRLLTLVLRQIDETDGKKRIRDFRIIMRELHLRFPDRLPPEWGMRD